jgi:ABC-type lipoprotein export system ATPase subunit
MIAVKNVYKDYLLEGENFRALNDVSLTINSREFTSIVGPSGCGKSTLMHIIGLLDRPSKGEIVIGNEETSKLGDDALSRLRNEYIGFVFQQFNLINKLTILENVLLPTIYSTKKFDFDPKQRAQELLDRFGILQKQNSYPNKISGGQQQRVAIARALIMKPELILADEPTGNLDTKTGAKIMELLETLNNEGNTVVIVTHDMEIAEKTKRQIKMRDGEIIK